MDKKQEFLIKIQNYKGQVIAGWKAPKTKKQAGYAVEKLMKLFIRCRDCGLLTRELATAIKSYAEALLELAQVKAWLIAKPWLVDALRDLRAIKIEDMQEEIVVEKMRKHTQAVCSLCKIPLKYPAYIVYRKGTEIVKVSQSVGIFCLKSLCGKLNDLVTEIQAQIKQIEALTEKNSSSKQAVHSASPRFKNSNIHNNKQLSLII